MTIDDNETFAEQSRFKFNLTEVAVHLFHPRELALAVAEPDVNLLTYESIVAMMNGVQTFFFVKFFKIVIAQVADFDAEAFRESTKFGCPPHVLLRRCEGRTFVLMIIENTNLSCKSEESQQFGIYILTPLIGALSLRVALDPCLDTQGCS